MQCDREGSFRGKIVEYGMKEFASGTVAIKFKAELTEIYDFGNKCWEPWGEYQMEVFGDVFVVKKDGTLNEDAIKSLVDNAGWNGSFHSVEDKTWEPVPCQFSVKRSDHNGKTYFNASFINAFDSVPGGTMPKLDEGKVKSLDTRFSAQLRALVGNKMRNQDSPTANSKPPAPPAAKPEAVAAAASKPGDDGIPF
jgi:hypothetical protein